MKGRKPKYPQDVINDLAARQAAGESASALSEQTGIARTTIIRCKDSARVPAEAKESNLQIARDAGAVTRERLFWRDVDALLRRISDLAPKLSEKAIPEIVDSLIKLRPLLAGPRLARSSPEIQKDEETLMIFRRQFKKSPAQTIEASPVEESSQGVLGGPKGDTSESASDGEPAGGPGQTGEANGAT